MRISDWSSDVCSSDLPNPRTEPGHTVAVKPGTLLAQIAGTAELAVNSAHHQAAKDEPAGVVVSGRAPDGVIEAIESPAHHFCLGVQWHPEYAIDPADPKIFADRKSTRLNSSH